MVREHSDFNYFTFIEVCFTAQDMVYLAYVLWVLEKNLYFPVVGWSVLRSQLDPVGSWLSFSIYSY